MRLFRLIAVASIAVGLGSRVQGQASTDSLYARAQTLVGAGNGVAGRALVDSLLAASTPGTNAYAEALYWKARFAETAAAAERAFLQVAVEYPLSPLAGDALIRLAVLESSRNDRASAARHLARLTREHPLDQPPTQQGLWGVRLLFDQGNPPAACALLSMTRAGVATGDVEVANQMDYMAGRCINVASATADSTAATAAAADSATTKSTPTNTRAAPTRPAYSVQIAAYKARADADALAKRLTRRGYQARVTVDAPYRVRVGRYPTRPEAIAALQKMRQSNLTGIVVEAEKR
jgi:cell division septation protein DedD